MAAPTIGMAISSGAPKQSGDARPNNRPNSANTLSEHTIEALRGVLTADQKKASIPDNSRVELRTLNQSSKGYLMKGPSRTASILVLILAILGTVAVTHLLAALRDREKNSELEGIIDPWAAEGAPTANGNGQHGPRTAPEPASIGWSGTPAPPAAWAQPPAPPRGGNPGRRTEQ